MNKIHDIYEGSQYKILFKEFYIPLVHFAVQHINTPEAAEDIVQEIFVQLWEKELNFENELALRTYLYRSTQNRCFNYLRDLKIQQRYEKHITHELKEQETPSILSSIIREEVYRQLLISIDHLPPQCKKICTLTLEGKKPSEIAQELELAVETVKKQKKIALKRIQDELGALSLASLSLSLWMLTHS